MKIDKDELNLISQLPPDLVHYMMEMVAGMLEDTLERYPDLAAKYPDPQEAPKIE